MDSAVDRGVAAFVGVARDEIGHMPRAWTFDITGVIKGDLPATIEVRQAMSGEYGPTFEVGELTGVVLFRREGDHYITDDCGGVWRPEELRTPGAVAAPTGGGPVALIAAGRSGPATLASFDAEGHLTAWAVGGAANRTDVSADHYVTAHA